MDHFGRTLAFSSLATISACGLALLWLLPETRRAVGALASAAQTAPSLKSERKRSRLSATAMLERIPLMSKRTAWGKKLVHSSGGPSEERGPPARERHSYKPSPATARRDGCFRKSS